MLGLDTNFAVEVANSPLWLLVATGFALYALMQRDRFKDLAQKDPLTNMFNKLILEDVKRKEQAKLDRGDTQGIAVINIDLNKFKPVNDTYGHDAGDAILKQTATQLQSLCRKYDTAIRIGGDEFVMVLTDINEADLKSRLQEIRQNLQSIKAIHPHNKDVEIEVGASVGCAHIKPGQSIKEGLKLADDAMYKAKPAGSRTVSPAPVK